jgi:hypothetical protein
MKLYKFHAKPSTEIPSTRTIVSFVKAMIKMHRDGHDVFTALDVMNYALDNGLWSTTQLTDEKRMTTWAFYVKKLKSIGLEECGETSTGSKKTLTIDDLLNEFQDDANDEGFDEDHELDLMTRPETEHLVESND